MGRRHGRIDAKTCSCTGCSVSCSISPAKPFRAVINTAAKPEGAGGGSIQGNKRSPRSSPRNDLAQLAFVTKGSPKGRNSKKLLIVSKRSSQAASFHMHDKSMFKPKPITFRTPARSIPRATSKPQPTRTIPSATSYLRQPDLDLPTPTLTITPDNPAKSRGQTSSHPAPAHPSVAATCATCTAHPSARPSG